MRETEVEMSYFLYGAGGVLLALALLAAGMLLGWKGRGAWQEHTKQAVVKEATEEEKRQLEEEQRAFRGMLNYNAEMAYGHRRERGEGE